MNYQFQPSAMGLSAKDFNDFITNRSKIAIALYDMNTTINDAQLKMGKASSDSAYASGVADSEATRQAAWLGLVGAGLSIGTSAFALNRQHSNFKKNVPDTVSALGAQQVNPANAAPIGAAPAPNPNGVGATDLGVQHGVPVVQPAAANQAGVNNNNNAQVGANNQAANPPQGNAEANQWQNYWAQIGRDFPSAMSKVMDSFGNVLASGEKMKKASADRDQAIEQSIKSMMEAQSRVNDSAMQGNDGGTNSAIQTIQALIQANRAG